MKGFFSGWIQYGRQKDNESTTRKKYTQERKVNGMGVIFLIITTLTFRSVNIFCH